VAITSPREVGGQAGDPAARHLFASRKTHGGLRPQPGGLNQLLDRATCVGVMPLGERAPWL
jgi:hypothetical protein